MRDFEPADYIDGKVAWRDYLRRSTINNWEAYATRNLMNDLSLAYINGDYHVISLEAEWQDVAIEALFTAEVA